MNQPSFVDVFLVVLKVVIAIAGVIGIGLVGYLCYLHATPELVTLGLVIVTIIAIISNALRGPRPN